MTRRFLMWAALLSVAFLVAVGLATFIGVAKHKGDGIRRDIKACHAMGPRYHYWQDRERCVRYVD